MFHVDSICGNINSLVLSPQEWAGLRPGIARVVNYELEIEEPLAKYTA